MMQGIPTPSFQLMGIARGKSVSIGRVSLGVAAWATDPIGTTTVKFSGVNVGSEIRVYLPDDKQYRHRWIFATKRHLFHNYDTECNNQDCLL